MRRLIVLHKYCENEPIIIFVESIKAIETVVDNDIKYSAVHFGNTCIDVKETVGQVLNKMKEVERE